MKYLSILCYIRLTIIYTQSFHYRYIFVVHLMSPYLELVFVANFFHCDKFVLPFEVPYEVNFKNCAMCFCRDM
jgi:hypothetical protein